MYVLYMQPHYPRNARVIFVLKHSFDSRFQGLPRAECFRPFRDQSAASRSSYYLSSPSLPHFLPTHIHMYARRPSAHTTYRKPVLWRLTCKQRSGWVKVWGVHGLKYLCELGVLNKLEWSWVNDRELIDYTSLQPVSTRSVYWSLQHTAINCVTPPPLYPLK